jgi:L,D-transpeptidase YcbB
MGVTALRAAIFEDVFVALRHSFLSLFVILARLLFVPSLALPAQASNVTQPGASQACSAITQSELCPLIEAGHLNDLRWPDFTDLGRDVRDFYLPFGYTLAWVRENQPTPQALAIIRSLQDAEKKGLRAEDYDGPFWDDRIARLVPPAPLPSDGDLARFDLTVTVSVMRYISALHDGRINPRHLRFGLEIEGKKYKLADFLRARLVQAQDVKSVLDQVEPPYAGYRRTEMALEHYLILAGEGEGESLPAFKKPIKPGDAYAGLGQLSQRLRRLGDLPQQVSGSIRFDVYEGALVEAVKHFQQRHGLPADGSIDRATFNQIVTPLSRRTAQLQLTLERWRWLPPDLPTRFIAINVPEFELRAYDDHRPSLSMRVVVGSAFHDRQTPVFQDEMEYVIFRPYWNVPVSITRKELIPEIEKNPGYLEKHEFEVVDRRGEVVSAETTDSAFFARLRSGALEIRQKPGPRNSLGLIKFVFPNNYDVYLHGTPEHALFSRSRRAFSHGCIRIEDPAALADWVLRDDPSWTADRIQAAMNADGSERVNLTKPIPVLVLYGTARVDENGEAHFFDDLYGQDTRLERKLAAGYPYAHQRSETRP